MIDPQVLSVIQWIAPPIVGVVAGYGVLYMRSLDRDSAEKTKSEMQVQVREQIAFILDAKFAHFENSMLEKLSARFVSSGGITVSGPELLRRLEAIERQCKEWHPINPR